MSETAPVNVCDYMNNLAQSLSRTSQAASTSSTAASTTSKPSSGNHASKSKSAGSSAITAIGSASKQAKQPEVSRGVPKRAQNVLRLSGYIRAIEDLNRKAERNNLLMDMYEEELNSCQEQIVQLKQQNADFKRAEFWRAHNTKKLGKLMCSFNLALTPPCACKVCIEAGRNPHAELTSDGESPTQPCSFALSFECLLTQYELKFAHVEASNADERIVKHDLLGGKCYGAGAGVAIVNVGRDRYWRNVAYGPAFSASSRPTDDLLVRLRHLFRCVRINGAQQL